MDVFCYYGGLCISKSGLCYVDCSKRKQMVANVVLNKTSEYENSN